MPTVEFSAYFDCEVGRNNTIGDETFSQLRNNLAGTWLTVFASYFRAVVASAFTGGLYRVLARVILQFDTASLPDDASIISATLRLRVLDKYKDANYLDGEVGISLVEKPNYDYYPPGTTRYSGDKLYSEIPVGESIFTFNGVGLAAISKIGLTKMALQLICDTNNDTPDNWSDAKEAIITVASSRHATVAYRPKLTVEYGVAPPPTAQHLMMMGVG